MKRYSQEKLREVAKQIYGEMSFLLGNDTASMKGMLGIVLSEWGGEFTEKIKAYLPNCDLEMARQAYQYLHDNISEFSSANEKVIIPEKNLKRFGFLNQ
jgi:hypothetical protein